MRISTHTLRKEGDDKRLILRFAQVISTHTLRKEGDYWMRLHSTPTADFNPHPPQGG